MFSYTSIGSTYCLVCIPKKLQTITPYKSSLAIPIILPPETDGVSQTCASIALTTLGNPCTRHHVAKVEDNAPAIFKPVLLTPRRCPSIIIIIIMIIMIIILTIIIMMIITIAVRGLDENYISDTSHHIRLQESTLKHDTVKLFWQHIFSR